MGLFGIDFSPLRKSASDVGARLRELRQELADKKAEREALLNAPAAKEDIVAAIDRWIDRRAGAFDKGLSVVLGMVGRTGNAAGDDTRVDKILQFPLIDDPLRNLIPACSHGLEPALAGLFGEQMRAALLRAVDRLPGPFGPPQAARTKRLQELEARILQLQMAEREAVAEVKRLRAELGGA